MTATYWEIGRRVMEFEQGGAQRAEYREKLIKHPAGDLTRQFGRGFGAVNLSRMRRFYIEWPPKKIFQTPSEKSVPVQELASKFPLPWSAYVRLLSVKNPNALNRLTGTKDWPEQQKNYELAQGNTFFHTKPDSAKTNSLPTVKIAAGAL